MSFTYKHLSDEEVANSLEKRRSEPPFAPDGLIFRAPGSLREMIQEEVERQLHPGMPDPRSYIHATIRNQEGHVYRGMLYLIEPQEEDMPSSTPDEKSE